MLTGIITTIAGIGTTSFNGDGGAATSASLYYPIGSAADSSGIDAIILRESDLLFVQYN